jgi:hypothetical protein
MPNLAAVTVTGVLTGREGFRQLLDKKPKETKVKRHLTYQKGNTRSSCGEKGKAVTIQKQP